MMRCFPHWRRDNNPAKIKKVSHATQQIAVKDYHASEVVTANTPAPTVMVNEAIRRVEPPRSVREPINFEDRTCNGIHIV